MSDTKQQSGGMNITAEQLMEILKEVRKPADPTPLELRKLEQQQEARKQMGLKQRDIEENNRRIRRFCSHIRRDGTARVVHVKGHHFVGDPGYLICQKCRAIIKPGTAPKNNYQDHFYDTELFNKLFQMSTGGNTFD
jgi:hypothetical protein